MPELSEEKKFRAGEATVEVHATAKLAGAAAARQAAYLIQQAILTAGRARIIAATGNSQIPLMDALAGQKIPWSSVQVFHMDEYVGLSVDHPASFRRWIQQRIETVFHPGQVIYLKGDSADVAGEIRRYADLLNEAPVDVAFVGFGENGHIAFNDPHEADFADPALVKVANLDEACRLQQVGEGHFRGLSDVPASALTITCTGLFRAVNWVCCVPETRKAKAVHCALLEPVSPSCPASLVQRHPRTFVYLDRDSASRLPAFQR